MDFRVEAEFRGENGNAHNFAYDFKSDSHLGALATMAKECEPTFDEIEKNGLKMVNFKFLKNGVLFLSE